MWGKYNVFLLLVAIKGPTYKFGRHKNQSHTLHDANQKFCRYYQTRHTSKPQYLKTFNNRVSVIYSYGVSIGTYSGLAKADLMEISKNSSYSTDAERQQAAEAAKKKHLGVVMLCGANRGRYGKLVEELWNDFTKRNDYYPEYLTEAYNLLINYKTLYYKLASRLVEDPEGV